MEFDYSPKVKDMQARLLKFMDEYIYPNEARFFREIAENRAKGNPWVPTTLIEELKPKARAAGLWNLFLPKSPRAPEGLSNLEYAPLCEIMGRVPFAAEVFNCSAPDTGNMETLERYASESLKDQWLEPLLKGDSSAFPDDRAGSSFVGCDQYPLPDRTRRRRIRDQRPQVVVVRRGRPVLRGLYRHGQDQPRRGPARATIDDRRTLRQQGHHRGAPLTVFGWDDAPHGHMEVLLETVGFPPRICCWAKGADSKSPKGASARAASIIACVPSAAPSVRSS